MEAKIREWSLEYGNPIYEQHFYYCYIFIIAISGSSLMGPVVLWRRHRASMGPHLLHAQVLPPQDPEILLDSSKVTFNVVYEKQPILLHATCTLRPLLESLLPNLQA